MSYRVLIVPEDPTYNGAILHPLVCRILEDCGRGNAKVKVLTNPKVQGFEHARQQMPAIVERYRHFDLILFLVDDDGRSRSASLRDLESHFGSKLICCAAIEEVEVWLLAGHDKQLDRPWSAVRADTSVKENVFVPFLRRFGDARRAGGGRDLLMNETLTNFPGLLSRCPELGELRDRICRALAS